MSQINSGGNNSSGLPTVDTLTGDSGGAVGPDINNNINIVGGVGVAVVGVPLTNTLTISVLTGGISWHVISASQTLAVNSGYFCISPGGVLSLSLPAVSSIGDNIILCLDGATSWTISQGAGQAVKFGNLITTAGVGGSISSTQQGDSLTLVCRIPNLRWVVKDSSGNPIII